MELFDTIPSTSIEQESILGATPSSYEYCEWMSHWARVFSKNTGYRAFSFIYAQEE